MAYIEDVPIPAGANLTTANQGSNQLDLFFIGNDGALFVAWVVGFGIWEHPFRISQPGMAPAGAPVVAIEQKSGQLDVFFIGNDGGLYVAWVIDGGIWQGPQLISPVAVAPPSGYLTAAKQTDNQLSVFFIGLDLGLDVMWSVDGGIWQGPQSIGSPDVPYPRPGSGIAVANQTDDQLDVFFIGEDRGLYVAWVVGGGIWQGPQRVADPVLAVAPAGAPLTAVRQTEDLLAVLALGVHGEPTVVSVVGTGNWQGPAALSATMGQPGGKIISTHQLANQSDVFFIGSDGALNVFSSIDNGDWQGPFTVAPAATTSSNAGLAVGAQSGSQTSLLFGGSAGELNVSWVRGGGIWQGPVRVNPEMVKMRLVVSGQFFFPFMIADPVHPWYLPRDQTPTGAFSYDGSVFVFFYAVHPDSASFLAVSADPEAPKPYTLLFEFSNGSSPSSGRFLQVAPVVVNNPGQFGVPTDAQDGVFLFGHGSGLPASSRPAGCVEPSSGGPFGVHLAFMPLHAGQMPLKEEILFYTGQFEGSWSLVESDALTLFETCYFWTSLSAGRIGFDGPWIILYQLSGPAEVEASHKKPIVARVAESPELLGSAAELPLFDPVRDGAWGKFMDGSPGSFAYGAYLLHKYTQFDPSRRVATIFYLMSTGSPYQVQLMTSAMQFDRALLLNPY